MESGDARSVVDDVVPVRLEGLRRRDHERSLLVAGEARVEVVEHRARDGQDLLSEERFVARVLVPIEQQRRSRVPGSTRTATTDTARPSPRVPCIPAVVAVRRAKIVIVSGSRRRGRRGDAGVVRGARRGETEERSTISKSPEAASGGREACSATRSRPSDANPIEIGAPVNSDRR